MARFRWIGIRIWATSPRRAVPRPSGSVLIILFWIALAAKGGE
jgi:hypothetical protein